MCLCQREDYEDDLQPDTSSRAVSSKTIVPLRTFEEGKHVHKFCAKHALKCSQNTGVFGHGENTAQHGLQLSAGIL